MGMIDANVQVRLEKELESLKRKLNINDDLKVRWIPNGSKKFHGEVKGQQIFVYDYNLESAVETLRHEVIDYLVSKAIRPYMEFTNKMILMFNEKAYEEKEKIVETLLKLL